ncbi:MAG: tetratricopeptide (TPR) repeat protein [Planctomycetota bacterium]|jgi:tetratricopeptide (TPR) repeat protein
MTVRLGLAHLTCTTFLLVSLALGQEPGRFSDAECQTWIALGLARRGQLAGDTGAQERHMGEAEQAAKTENSARKKRALRSLVKELGKVVEATNDPNRHEQQLAQNLAEYAAECRVAGRLAAAREYLDLAAGLYPQAVQDLLAEVVVDIEAQTAGLHTKRASVRDHDAIVARGDRAYYEGDKQAALEHYLRAQEGLQAFASNKGRYERVVPRSQRIWHEYTYEHLYDSHDAGFLSQQDLSFLKVKIELCTREESERRPVIYKAVALIIRETDIEWTNQEGEQGEQSTLDDEELLVHKIAWKIAMDAVAHYSAGRVRVETEWIELEGATLTGLTSSNYRSLVSTRHLDPSKIVPAQDELFKRVVRDHDYIAFVWDRGRSAQAFGGGPILLPYKGGRLELRGSVKNMPSRAVVCLHEFMHSIERRVEIPRVHGPRGNWLHVFKEAGVQDATDWYIHLIRSVGSWKKAKYL